MKRSATRPRVEFSSTQRFPIAARIVLRFINDSVAEVLIENARWVKETNRPQENRRLVLRLPVVQLSRIFRRCIPGNWV